MVVRCTIKIIMGGAGLADGGSSEMFKRSDGVIEESPLKQLKRG